MTAGMEEAMQSWELFATLGATLAAWGAMLGLMWRMHTSVRKDLAGLRGEMRREIASLRSDLGREIASLRGEIASVRDDLGGQIAALRDALTERIANNERALVGVSEDLAEFRGEMRGELKGINVALLVLREDFRAHVHGVHAG